MSMKDKRSYDLAVVQQQARVKYPTITVNVGGEVFEIDPPQLWNDTAIDPKVGPKDTAAAVLGEAEFARWIAAGGTVAGFNLILAQYTEDQGLELGESSAS